MKTEKEVRDYLRFCKIERDDVLRIFAYLEGKGIKLVPFIRTIIDEPKQLKYDDFVQWFNEPNEKVEDEVTETPLDVYNAFIERCRTGVDVLLRPDDVKMGEKFIILPHLIYDNSYQQDLAINGKELKVTNPKFPIGTKVVRKSKPNGKVYTIKKYFTEGRKGVKGRYLAVADDGSFMYGVRESKLEKYEESSKEMLEHKRIEGKANNDAISMNDLSPLLHAGIPILNYLADFYTYITEDEHTVIDVISKIIQGKVNVAAVENALEYKCVEGLGSKEADVDLGECINEQMERIRANTEALLKDSNERPNTIKSDLATKADDPKAPEYKVGDWIRVVNVGKTYSSYFHMFYKMGFREIPEDTPEDCMYDPTKHHIEYGRIFAVDMHEYRQNGYLYGIEFEDKQLLIGERGIELYEPKEGEFAFVSTTDTSVGYVFHKKDYSDKTSHNYSFYEKYNIVFKESTCCNDIDIKILRPATEEEKQTLIKAVEEKYNKTYCEETKQWVDMKPKSAIDELNEKQEVRIKRGKKGAFNVYVGDFCAYFLSYDEMLGTVAALLTPPDIRERKCLHWLKTKEQHLAGGIISPELREEMGITDEQYETICNRQ